MYQDNEREIFTVNNIKSDLYRHLLYDLTLFFILAVLLIILALLLIYLKLISLIAIYFIIVIWGIASLILLIRIIKVATNNFYVDSDVMIESAHTLSEKDLKKYKNFSIQRPSKNTGYNITHYHWSKKYNMDYHDFFNTSKIGDEFYVITFNKRKAYFIYNKEFFKYIDD